MREVGWGGGGARVYNLHIVQCVHIAAAYMLACEPLWHLTTG